MTDITDMHRWYCLSSFGAATLCVDEADARATAKEANGAYPKHAPHRAVQLVAASEVERVTNNRDMWKDQCAMQASEISALRATVERYRVGWDRYETVRRLSAQQFAEACALNLSSGKHFDEIIDGLHPLRAVQGVKG